MGIKLAKTHFPISHTVFLILVGLFSGAMYGNSIVSEIPPKQFFVDPAKGIFAIFASCIIMSTAILFELRRYTFIVVSRLSLSESEYRVFLKYQPFTYLVFMGYALVMFGFTATLSFFVMLLCLYVMAQLFLLWLSTHADHKAQWLNSVNVVPVLFFISGFAALIYQIVWQRVLFSTFGVNIESVTVIVSVFMFGLGIGAWLSGQLQKFFSNRILEAFIIIEIAIGIYGIFSISFIHAAAVFSTPNSIISLISTTYALLALPTLLMGATLPLLVSFLQRYFINFGTTVGTLYAYNTLGSALAALLTVVLLFTVIGLQTTIYLAAFCNILTAILVGAFCRRLRRRGTIIAPTNQMNIMDDCSIGFRRVLLLSFAVGYAAISLEIIWFRIIGFMSQSRPQVFGSLLAVFLLGIALGSLKASKLCESKINVRHYMCSVLLKMAAITYFSIPIISYSYLYAGKAIAFLLAYSSIGVLAYFSGTLFPLLCQAAAAKRPLENTISWVYLFNIIGATLGSLITGFVLFEVFSLPENILVVTFSLFLTLSFLFLSGRWEKKPAPLRLMLFCTVIFASIALQPFLFRNAIDNLQGIGPLKHILENRSGILTVKETVSGDAIFGNGAYDGLFNIDPANESNLISRAYFIAALHPAPKDILQIGMSSGSWTRVFSMYEPLDSLTTVEINSGYTDIIKHYPDSRAILSHPKVKIINDDGRRWLNQNPDRRFDIITMNTTYYWRSNATNLLSTEMLNLCKRHLKPGGIVYYITTNAEDNIYTAAHVFKHVVIYANMVAASDSPFTITSSQKRENLLKFYDQGMPIFVKDNKKRWDMLTQLSEAPLEDIHSSILARRDLWLITDDNVASEFKVDHSFLPPNF